LLESFSFSNFPPSNLSLLIDNNYQYSVSQYENDNFFTKI
jgi:hypothetical protein